MSEEVVTNVDTSRLDESVRAELFEYRRDAVEACVAYYGTHFDKVFAKLTQSLDKSEEKSKKLNKIKEKHLKDYENYIQKRLDKEMNQLLSDPKLMQRLVDLSDNRLDTDLVDIQKAIHPIKQQFIEQLNALKQSIDETYDTRSKQLTDLDESLTQTMHSYESSRHSVQKRVRAIVKQLDSIEIQDLE